jgi:hydroxypyruvate reductase
VFKGGQLARAAYPSTLLALILSDVIGDDLDVIGSGATAPDASTVADARRVLERFGVAPPGTMVETPKPGDPVFANVENLIVGSNRLAVDAAAARARELGYRTVILSTRMEGEAREVARVHGAIAQEIVASGRPVRTPACIVSGGETTVTVRGKGLGGRSQEFALSAAMHIMGLKDTLILAAGTDGTDGPTDAAGAITDGTTIARAQKQGVDPVPLLADNDSYHFFEPLGDLIKTGPTGTNVMDIQLILVR